MAISQAWRDLHLLDNGLSLLNSLGLEERRNLATLGVGHEASLLRGGGALSEVLSLSKKSFWQAKVDLNKFIVLGDRMR